MPKFSVQARDGAGATKTVRAVADDEQQLRRGLAARGLHVISARVEPPVRETPSPRMADRLSPRAQVILRWAMAAPAILLYALVVFALSSFGGATSAAWIMGWSTLMLLPFALLAVPHVVAQFKCPERVLRITLVSYFAPVGFWLLSTIATLVAPEARTIVTAIDLLIMCAAFIGGLVWSLWPKETTP